jgi:delta14-sterol reductase
MISTFRLTLPFLGEIIDIKTWCEVCPGWTRQILLYLAFVAQQYTSPTVSSSPLRPRLSICSATNTTNPLPWLWLISPLTARGLFSPSVISSKSHPCTLSTQCRYLAVYPVHLGFMPMAAVSAFFILGIYISKAANNQKHMLQTQPTNSAIAKFSCIQTITGRTAPHRWMVGGTRPVNYFGILLILRERRDDALCANKYRVRLERVQADGPI